jgi:hypothetical protein
VDAFAYQYKGSEGEKKRNFVTFILTPDPLSKPKYHLKWVCFLFGEGKERKRGRDPS